MDSNTPALPLSEAPGAKAARVCGILALVCACTCICFPVGVVLGIVALVQAAKSRRFAAEFPQDYRVPTSAGMTLGIVGLVLSIVLALPGIGVISAIAIPALLSQRGRAMDKAASSNLMGKLGELVVEYEKGKAEGLDQMAIHASMERLLKTAPERNPFNLQAPAFRYTIPFVAASSEEEAKLRAEAAATTEGEVVFVVAFPTDPQKSGYLAGAVRHRLPVDGMKVYSRTMALD